MTEQYGLPASAIHNICAIFQQYPQIEKVMLYGSRAKGSYRVGSDIDLSIQGDVDVDTLLKIENEIDDLLLPWSVDLSILHKIDNMDLVEHIRRCGVVFYDGNG